MSGSLEAKVRNAARTSTAAAAIETGTSGERPRGRGRTGRPAIDSGVRVLSSPGREISCRRRPASAARSRAGSAEGQGRSAGDSGACAGNSRRSDARSGCSGKSTASSSTASCALATSPEASAARADSTQRLARLWRTRCSNADQLPLTGLPGVATARAAGAARGCGARPSRRSACHSSAWTLCGSIASAAVMASRAVSWSPCAMARWARASSAINRRTDVRAVSMRRTTSTRARCKPLRDARSVRQPPGAARLMPFARCLAVCPPHQPQPYHPDGLRAWSSTARDRRRIG